MLPRDDEDIAQRMSDEDTIPDDLEVLKSIYPEVEIGATSISLDIKLKPETKVQVKLTVSEKVLDNFESLWFERLHFKADLPLSSGEFHLESRWLDEDVLQSISSKLEEMRSEAKEAEMLDSFSYTILNYLTVELVEEFNNELFPKDGITTDSKEHYQLLEKLSERERIRSFQNDRFDCSICLESYDGRAGILLDCDHAFCKPCFKEYSMQIINSNDVTTLQCPNCPIVPLKNLSSKRPDELKKLLFTRKIRLEDLAQVIEAPLVAKYENDRLLVLFEKYQNYYPFACSKCPRCEKWGFRDDLDDNLVICQHCKLAYCYECNHSWHGNNNYCRSKLYSIPIDVILDMMNLDLDESSKLKHQQQYGRRTLNRAVNDYIAEQSFEKAIEEDESLVKCPQCSTVVTKLDGCHKMKCSVCSTNFCFRCSTQLDAVDPYIHYADPFSPCYKMLFEGMVGT